MLNDYKSWKAQGEMNYSVIREYDIANGPGCRTTLFVSGCRNHCKGCFQPETWDFSYGKLYDETTEHFLLDCLEPDYVSGLTILGGDPFEEENQPPLAGLLEKVRARYQDRKSIWAYTGYIYERDLREGGRKFTDAALRMLRCLDVLVDGPFIQEKKDLSLQFRGSANQRILDMPKTLAAGKGVLATMYKCL